MTNRCAIYARYSSDHQSPASISDQIRKCREYAVQHEWTVLEEHVYTDGALSGAGIDRPGLQELLKAAERGDFDVVLVDDTSRISRNLADSVRTAERLKFIGVRVIAVSQGIDTLNEQAEVLMTVHGLADSLYIKELSKKTHRGLEGRALNGFSTGGSCFGYDNIREEAGVRLQINDSEAATVRYIFQMCANGRSLKAIAKRLNAEGVPSPRPRAGKQYATWCPSAIRSILHRELYRGRIVWNQSRFVKVPGTNKRVRRPRPETEWRVIENPELKIVDDELWGRVQERLTWTRSHYDRAGQPGLASRAASSPYLLSGFLQCGLCGANMVIVTGRGKAGHPRYGCPQNFYRGACPNALKERSDVLEGRLFEQLQNAVLSPDVVEYTIEEFGKQLREALANVSTELSRMRERKRQIDGELSKLTSAIAQAGHSPALLTAIAERERELRDITERLLADREDSVEAHLASIREFVAERLCDIRSLLKTDVPQARMELSKHITRVRMVPEQGGDRPHYVAEGEWNLLGGYRLGGKDLPGKRVRVVAGGGFVLHRGFCSP